MNRHERRAAGKRQPQFLDVPTAFEAVIGKPMPKVEPPVSVIDFSPPGVRRALLQMAVLTGRRPKASMVAMATSGAGLGVLRRDPAELVLSVFSDNLPGRPGDASRAAWEHAAGAAWGVFIEDDHSTFDGQLRREYALGPVGYPTASLDWLIAHATHLHIGCGDETVRQATDEACAEVMASGGRVLGIMTWPEHREDWHGHINARKQVLGRRVQ
jgi:hypothetical protein